MPDISMCKGDGCPLRDRCYRHIATPSERRQTYFAVSPHVGGLGCQYFWSNAASQETAGEE
jgi:hypothetical protein